MQHLRKTNPEPQTRRPRRWEQRMHGAAPQQARSMSKRAQPQPAEQPQLRAVPLHGSFDPAPEPEPATCPPCHWGLLVTTLLLTGLSIPLVYSASTALSLQNHNGSTFFLMRQIFYVILSVAVMIGVSRLPRRSVITLGWILYGLTVVGLIAIKWSPLGVTMGGVERWLKIGPVPFQVSELGKIALLLVLAHFWSLSATTSGHNRGWKPWLLSGGILTLPLILLVLLQPHLSAAAVLFCILLIVGFFAGTPLRQFGRVMGAIALLGSIVITLSLFGKMPLIKPYQQERIVHFLSPNKEKEGANYQTLQGLRAISRGGLLGVGPGNSVYKQGYLPAPHTDFILAVTGEEWGLLGMMTLLALYGCLIFFCLQVGHNAGNMFEMLVATGMAGLLFVQVFCNMGVVLGILPVTGMLLPFISYGGSGLLCLLMGMGLVLGISRHQGISDA